MNIESVAENFCHWAEQSLETLAKLAAKKKKTKKKLDPKAKVRNRGTVCVPASQAKDKKDHFPINNIDQARNALARVHQYSSAPPWYKGSLKGLQSLVSRKVHAKYPSIGKSDKKSKKTKKSEFATELLKLGTRFDNKLAQMQVAPQAVNPAASQPNVQDIQNKMNQALAPFGYSITPGAEVRVMQQEGYVDVPVKALPNAKWKDTGHQANELKKLLDPLAPKGLTTRPVVSIG